MAVDRDTFYAELDGLNEHHIQAMIVQGLYNVEKRKLAEAYLDEKEAARVKVRNADALSIAKSGVDAAWTSAKAAEEANNHARLAISVSIFSALIGAAGLVTAIIALLEKAG